MSTIRASIRSVTRYAALVALGLTLGLVWHMMQSDRKLGQPVDISWLGSALDAVRNVVVPDAPGPGLPPFALRGTMVASDPANSTAIFDLGKGRVLSLRQGATLTGVGRLLEISGRGVYLEVNGRRRLFTFNDSTLAASEMSTPAQLQFPVQVAVPSGLAGGMAQVESAPGARLFVVPANAPVISDAPSDEPELNATPKPGQSIDTTVWN
jgi:hypothetical protein